MKNDKGGDLPLILSEKQKENIYSNLSGIELELNEGT
ncbi:hypothetical protein M2149_000790 [Lachnospiraceae bacterium PFB1-21]